MKRNKLHLQNILNLIKIESRKNYITSTDFWRFSFLRDEKNRKIRFFGFSEPDMTNRKTLQDLPLIPVALEAYKSVS